MTSDVVPGDTSNRGSTFSLPVYLLIVFALSWPFQLGFIFLGDNYRPLLLLSMLMAGVATFVAGRYLFTDGFTQAGWRRGKPVHYVLVLAFALFLWLVPVILEQGSGARQFSDELLRWSTATFFLTSFVITLAPAFAEEFSWRGYLLPRLFARHSRRKALLLHGMVTWLWHVPFIVTMGFEFGGDPWLSVPLVLVVSVVPTVMHAVVFAWIWASTRSLGVVTVYHAAFDEVRDTLEVTVGFAALSENWQMIVLTILGSVLLWKVDWSRDSPV